jgi:hypothetical protein
MIFLYSFALQNHLNLSKIKAKKAIHLVVYHIFMNFLTNFIDHIMNKNGYTCIIVRLPLSQQKHPPWKADHRPAQYG